MRPWDGGNPHYMVDHKCREIDLLPLIHEINQALIHRVSLIPALSTRDNVLDYEPEQQLVQWLHVFLLDSLWGSQPWLLTQVLRQLQQPVPAQQALVLSNVQIKPVAGTPKITPNACALTSISTPLTVLDSTSPCNATLA